MKRFFAVMLALLLALPCAAVFAEGEELPFELVAPANVYANWLNENDSPTTTALSLSLSVEMTTFFQNLENALTNNNAEEFFSSYDFDEISMTAQIDWALDDVNDSVSGWHYNKYWDAHDDQYGGFGYDEDFNIRVGAWDGVDMGINNATEIISEYWITRGVSEDDLNGNPETHTPGLKDQLKAEQYSYHDDALFIDYAEHTMYLRARFVVSTSKDTDDGQVFRHYYSDWSNIAAVGKDAAEVKPLSDIAAPVISGLRMTDEEFNDNPVVAFTLTVPDELAANAALAASMGGGIYIETEARVKGDSEWTLMSNTTNTVKGGEMECALLHLVNDQRPTISKDTVIELRCRYRCSQPEQEDILSDYSNIISFGTDDISIGGNPGATSAHVPADNNSASDKCGLCHFCSRPLGICIFIWIAIILAIVIIIVIAAAARKKGRKN